MGTPFANPVVQDGTGSLVIPQIQSPNFSLAGQTGWAIMSNGDAYFFNLTAAGSITGASLVIEGASGTILVYSGTPAAGNLIASVAGMAGSDAQSNAYESGITAYVTVSGDTYAVQLGTLPAGLTGFAALTLQNLTSPATEAAAVLAKLSGAGCELEVYSGMSTALASPAALALSDSVMTGGNPTAAFGGASVTAGSFNGVPLEQEAPPTYTGAAYGAPPTSGGTVAGSAGGNLLTYMQAQETGFNALRTAYLALVSQLQASGVLS